MSAGLTGLLRKIKRPAERVPGAHRLYKWVTTQWGEGRVYRIQRGPMQGILWRRDNRFPYWYHTGLYEPHVSELFGSQLRPGDTVWDIGAHAGYHTLLAARAVGPEGRVIAIEADPEIAAVLRAQIQLNELRNCTVVEMAVWNEEGILRLVRQPDSRTNRVEATETLEESLTVHSITLDRLAEQYPPPDLIKMDIEGAEVLALQGAEGLFSGEQRPRVVLIALHGASAAESCRRFLIEHGYTLQQRPGFEEFALGIRRTEDH